MYYRYLTQPPSEHALPLNKWIRVSKKDWQGMSLQHRYHHAGHIELRDEYHFSSRAYALQQLWDACHAVTDKDTELKDFIQVESKRLFPLVDVNPKQNIVKIMTSLIKMEATRKRIWLPD